MASRASLNKNNSAVKRIMQEARELANDPCTDYSAAPLEDDIFEWHCTIRGTPGTEFEGGLYHFRILLPSEYPFRPPSIMMLTPNGRFELNTKICISFTNYHEELWQPAWGVRTAIIGLQGFFPLKGTAAVGVGAIEYPSTERKRLAALSRDWVCPRCNMPNSEHLPDPPSPAEGSNNSDTSEPNSTDSSISNPSPAPASAEGVSSDTPSTQAPSAPQPQPRIEEETLDQPPTPERIVVQRPIPLIAPKPTRPQSQTFITQPFDTPPRSPDRHLQPPRSGTGASASVGADSQPVTRDGTPQPGLVATTPKRPPVLLDTAICVLLVLMFALVARRFL